MKKIEKALSNNVYADDKYIYKQYISNDFKTKFGNQELKVLDSIGRKYEVEDKTIKISFIDHIAFDDNNISLKQLELVANALKEFWKNKTEGIELSGFINFKDDFEDEEELFSKAMDILKSGKQVILHNDVVEGNLLLVQDKIELIDFEYSGIGNIIFDIASFTTERELTNEQWNYFVDQFDDINKDDLEVVEKFLQLFWSKWAIKQYELTGKEIYKEIYDWKIKRYKEKET